MELVHATGGVHELLLARVKGMANVANAHDDRAFGGARLNHVATGATNFRFVVFRMYFRSHKKDNYLTTKMPDDKGEFCLKKCAFICAGFPKKSSTTFVKNPLDVLYDCRDYVCMSKTPVELTEAEWPVIKVVWETEPCTAPAVTEKLQKATGWTYSTVRTLMDRMVAKGALKAKKEGKITIYNSVITRQQAQRGELFYALKHAFNGALTPMVQCLLESKDLDENELAKIEELVRSRKKSSKK